MLGKIWLNSHRAAEDLGITEKKLSQLREKGLLKPGIHWKSSPYGQRKPWNPEVIYNTKLCQVIIKNSIMNNEYDELVA